ncbi:MAG: hypothetical protein ACRDQW_02170 [Haloechinothrix sp.]
MTVAAATRSRPTIRLDAQPRRLSADEAWDLVEQAQAGDDDAFAAIYRAHVNEIFGLLIVRTRDRPGRPQVGSLAARGAVNVARHPARG